MQLYPANPDSDPLAGARSNSAILWTYFESLVFVAHRPGPMPEDEFLEFDSDVRAHEGLTGIVVLAHDAPPGPKQRASIQRWFERTNARGAVLTDSIFARGGVTALRWFGVPIAAFRRRELDAALRFVGLPADCSERAKSVLRALADNARDPAGTRPGPPSGETGA